MPKPLAQPCSPSYPFQLTSLESDFDEIDRVVEYLRRVRNVDKVNLVGWSRVAIGWVATLENYKAAVKADPQTPVLLQGPDLFPVLWLPAAQPRRTTPKADPSK